MMDWAHGSKLCLTQKIETNGTKAKVIGKIFAGTSTQYKLALSSGVTIDALFPSHQDFLPGQEIPIEIDAEHLIAYEIAKPN